MRRKNDRGLSRHLVDVGERAEDEHVRIEIKNLLRLSLEQRAKKPRFQGGSEFQNGVDRGHAVVLGRLQADLVRSHHVEGLLAPISDVINFVEQ